MIVATHGRSIWILDDATPVQQLRRRRSRLPTSSTCARRCSSTRRNDRGFLADKGFWGKNPTYGAPISYYLASAADERDAAHP